MRVVHLPTNIASMPSHTVRALRALGVDAVGFEIGVPSAIVTGAAIETVPFPARKNLAEWRRFVAWYLRTIRDADIVHWYYETRYPTYGIDPIAVRLLRTPGVVEWQGSEIRIPEVEFADNPAYTYAWEHGYEFRGIETLRHSSSVQRRFAHAGFEPVAAPGMVQYVLPEYRERMSVIPRGIILDDFEVHLPDVRSARPRIVHAPSSPNAKGTPSIVAAVQQLRSSHDFDFVLLHDVPREQALAEIARADIFVDQMILGDYGMAAIEAMAQGKPVVCHVKPAVRARYADSLPIVEATPDTVASVLDGLLTDGERRRLLGQAGRQYVEEEHDAMKRAAALIAVYEKVIALHGR